MKYLDDAGLLYVKGKLDTKFNSKVDKISGKGLSENDYTTTEKNKLAGIEAGAQVNPDLTNYATKTFVQDTINEALGSIENILGGI